MAPNLENDENMNALFREEHMEKLLEIYERKIDVPIMKEIASDHGEPGTHTHMKSMCQYTKKPGYDGLTLVSYVGQPREKRFWYADGNLWNNPYEEIEL